MEERPTLDFPLDSRPALSLLLGPAWTRATQLGHIASRWTCKELCGAAWPAPRKQHDFFELQGTRAGCMPPLQHGTESKFIANWTRAGPAWTRRLNGLAKTHVDRRGPANIAPWTRKISYLTRGSKRDPPKTAFTWDQIMLPRSKWSTAAKTGLCGGFVWGL